MKHGRLNIYLADLDHFFPGNRISVPLNIGSIASYCKNIYEDEIEISLFKHPEELMKTIAHFPPHLLGLSFYMWNTNLALKVVECCRLISPSTITVIGGPSVSRISDRYKKLLEDNSYLDVVVLDQGEKSFSNILNRVLSRGISRNSIFTESIPGCAIRLNNADTIERGNIEDNIESLDKIPSPYLMGYLDRFLEAGFLPQLETTRGCPFSCTYCGHGDDFFSKLIVRDENIIYEELRYLLRHSKSRELSITDTNIGMLGERDLRISSFMLNLYKKHGFPLITDFASSKVKTKTSIEVMKNIARITGRMYFGLQTLTQKTLDNCKRKNISISTMKELISFSKKNNLSVSVDLIFGLPGETPHTFMETISKLISLGIEKPSIYQLKMLPGTILLEKERDSYQYITRFRPFNNRFGEYKLIPNSPPVRIIEMEEIAYQSNSFDSNDYMKIREYGFLTELLLKAFTEMVLYLSSRNINITAIIRIIQAYNDKYPKLKALFNSYKEYCEKEVFETEEDLINKICKDDKHWHDLLAKRGNYFKINLGFMGYCLFEDLEILDNIEQLIMGHVLKKNNLDEKYNLDKILQYDRRHWIIQKKKDNRLKLLSIEREISTLEYFDYKKWKINNFKGNLNEYKLKNPIQYVYYIEKYKDFIQKIKEYSDIPGIHFYERIMLYAPEVSLRRRSRRSKYY